MGWKKRHGHPDDLDILGRAHFLRIMAGSIGKTKYQEWNSYFKDLMSDPQGMRVYFNGNLTDKINICPRMQISYVNLRPEADSDSDGIINRLDPNPRIPEPKLVKNDVNVAVYYIVSWRQPLYQKPSDWEVGTSYHSLLGFYDCGLLVVVDYDKNSIEYLPLPTSKDYDDFTSEKSIERRAS